MASVHPNTSIRGYKDFITEVFGETNMRHFSRRDLLTNTQRYLMRGIKGIRKNDPEKIALNLVVSMGWLLSLMSRLQIDIEETVWKRFPYLCSYCGHTPCTCKEQKVVSRQQIPIDDAKRPTTLREFQAMFAAIYPPEKRTLEHAGIHLAEELGEVSEAFLFFKGTHDEKDYEDFMLESADLMSCYFGVFNSLGIDLAERLSTYYADNCHKCHTAPCTCTYQDMLTKG